MSLCRDHSTLPLNELDFYASSNSFGLKAGAWGFRVWLEGVCSAQPFYFGENAYWMYSCRFISCLIGYS